MHVKLVYVYLLILPHDGSATNYNHIERTNLNIDILSLYKVDMVDRLANRAGTLLLTSRNRSDMTMDLKMFSSWQTLIQYLLSFELSFISESEGW